MLEKRSISLSGHRTSIALEPEFWTALQEIAAGDGRGATALIASIDAQRQDGQALASALRVFVLRKVSNSNQGNGA